jgi:predicted HTH domain antitoxin
VNSLTHDIILTIPGSLVQEMKLPSDTVKEELLNELAVSLYRRRILTSAQACRLSGFERYQFEDLLWKRQILLHYSEEDLNRDIEHSQETVAKAEK